MSDQIPTPETAGQADEASDMILTFRLQGEVFALGVEAVNEILDPIAPTPVPRAHPAVPALINVRGAVVPLFDIRHRFGMPPEEPPGTARIVVLDLVVQGEATRLAMPVDAVENVVKAGAEVLAPIPALGARWPAEFIKGVAHLGDDMVILLNPRTLFDITAASAPHKAA